MGFAFPTVRLLVIATTEMLKANHKSSAQVAAAVNYVEARRPSKTLQGQFLACPEAFTPSKRPVTLATNFW